MMNVGRRFQVESLRARLRHASPGESHAIQSEIAHLEAQDREEALAEDAAKNAMVAAMRSAALRQADFGKQERSNEVRGPGVYQFHDPGESPIRLRGVTSR